MFKPGLTLKLILPVIFLVLISCGRSGVQQTTTEGGEPVVMTVLVGGMSCTGCEETIQSRVGQLDGVKSVRASFKDGTAIVEFLPGKTDSLKIREAITGSGYTVKKFLVP
jgi:copper chaperone CopZ